MKKQKKKWEVFRQYEMTAEEDYNCFCTDWVSVGTTYAVSEKQAINNVKFRRMGAKSQYLPLEASGHWETWYNWQAAIIGTKKWVNIHENKYTWKSRGNPDYI